MKKFKLFLGLVIVIFGALIVYQNREYFFAMQALSLNLGVETWHWTAPAVQNIAYIGAFFVIGLLITGFIGISSKLKSRKTIKSLNSTIEAHLEMIASLKTDLQRYKNDPYIKASEETPEAVALETPDDEAPAGNQEKKETE